MALRRTAWKNRKVKRTATESLLEREFVVQPPSSRHHSHVVRIYRQHSVHPKQSSVLRRHNLRPEGPTTQNVWKCNMMFQAFEKLPRGLTSDLPSDCDLMVGDFVRKTPSSIFSIGGPSESLLSQLDY